MEKYLHAKSKKRRTSAISTYGLLAVFFLLFIVIRGVEAFADSSRPEDAIKIGTPTTVSDEGWNLSQSNLSFNARAIYSVMGKAVRADIYITQISLWPKKRVITLKYPVLNTTEAVFSPRFSPDGTKVLFNLGWPYDRNGRYKIYLWDMATNDVHEVRIPFTPIEQPTDSFLNDKIPSLQFSFPLVHWSPNGRYISYVRGGDAYGDFTQDGHLFLDTFDLQQRIRHFLVRNDAVPYGYAWAPDNNLFYSAIEDSTINIYRISAEAEDRKLILKNAYRPTLSPNGNKIVFFGSEHTEEPINLPDNYLDIRSPHGLTLSVANADGTQRKALNRENLYYPQIVWLPDNKNFLTVDPGTVYTPDNGVKSRMMTTVSAITLWNVETGERKHICDIKAQDIELIHRTYVQRQFTPLEISADGKTLFIAISGMISRGQSGYNQRLSVKAVDIPSGKIYDVGHLSNVFDLQWRLERFGVKDLSAIQNKFQ